MKNNKTIYVLLVSGALLTIGAAIVSKNSDQRYSALNNLGISFASAGLALVTGRQNLDEDIK